MSVAVVKIPDTNLAIFKKLMKALSAKISVVKDEDAYEKKIMLKLIEESDDSEVVSENVIRKDFKKYGVAL
ncbi:MAG: hypothetical protein JNL63_12980 [Bacteroidia bacterium]|nr:hypothetical protein [Bacteroidia bacterium]